MDKKSDIQDSEDKIQADCFMWFDKTFPSLRDFLFHIPNGGIRSPVQAARMKAMGVRPGIPDLFLSVPKNGYAGMYIEMKTPSEALVVASRRKLSKHMERQLDVIGKLSDVGYICHICSSLDEFKNMINSYLNSD